MCGTILAEKPAGPSDELDKLLAGILDEGEKPAAAEPAGKPKGEKAREGEADELLDSLLVEEQARTGGGDFECPVCHGLVAGDARSCPKCGTEFAVVEPVTEEAAAQPAEEAPQAVEPFQHAPAPVVLKPAVKPAEKAKPPKAEVSDSDIPKTHIYEGRIIDFTIIGTIIALLAVFIGLKMYIFSNLNPMTLGIFFLIVLLGMAVVYYFFRSSTSAVAQGDKLVKRGLYNEAIQMYDRGIRLGVKPASAWTSKGVAFKRLGDLESALKCHNIALKINPGSEIAWCNKGNVLFKMDRLEEALRAYDRAIELKPKYAVAWNNKGATLAMVGRFDEAKDCYTKALSLKPRYVAAWLNQGEVLVRLGRRSEAEKCLRRAKALGA